MAPKGVAPVLRRPAVAVAKAVARLRDAAAADLRWPAGAGLDRAPAAAAPPPPAGAAALPRRRRPWARAGPAREPLRANSLVEALAKPPGSPLAASRAGLQLGPPRGRSRGGAFYQAALLEVEEPHGSWWREKFDPGRPAPLVHSCFGSRVCTAVLGPCWLELEPVRPPPQIPAGTGMRLRSLIVAAFARRLWHRRTWRRQRRELATRTVASLWRGAETQEALQEWLLRSCVHAASRPRRPALLRLPDDPPDDSSDESGLDGF